MKNLFFLVFIILTISFVSCEDAANSAKDSVDTAAEKVEESATNVADATKEMADDVANWSSEQADKLKSMFSTTESKLDHNIQQLEAKMKNASGDAKAEYKSLIEKLKGYKSQIATWGQNVTEDSQKQWEAIQDDMAKTLEEVQQAIKK